MKKLLSMFLVIGVFLSAFIAPVNAVKPTTGSITVSNATIGQEYAVYKLFDANIKFTDDNNVDGINYSIERTEENAVLFDALFGEDGKKTNPYFSYNPSTHEVKAVGIDTEIYAYLNNLFNGEEGLKGHLEPTATPITPTESNPEVKFEGLPFGYYLVTSSLGTAVTINSTTPDVTVIDKNQKPGAEFSKLIQNGTAQKKDENGDPVFDDDGNPVMEPVWAEQNSANIGDKVNYKTSFYATNYDGTNKIQYYQIHDEKGTALWVEFDSIEVYIDGEKLERGYYLCQGDVDALAAHEWNTTHFGDWGEYEKTPDNAQWFLVHLGYDKFRITIPWLEGHHIDVSTSTTDGVTTQNNSLSYSNVDEANFLYESPSLVEVFYNAGLEYDAVIGESTTCNLFNNAHASWTYAGDSDSTGTDSTDTKVYGIGLTKKDGNNESINLAGAEFELYRDEACQDPIYVIPTGIDGVYILDSLGTDIENISGSKKVTTREYYAAYLGEEYANGKQSNKVVSQVNGKLIVLGLAEGEYWFKEVKAPVGYNSLSAPHKITISSDSSRVFSIYADENGQVADVTHEDTIYHEIEYMLTQDIILNGKGATLPTTGAEGTMKIIATGTIITIFCAVLLITNKKMSVYKD